MENKKLMDRELIHAYLGGEEKAFETLLNRHKSKIYTSIYLFVKDESLANDIFQETFIKIIDTIRKGKYNDEGKFLQWALRIGYNLCVDNHRRTKRIPFVAPNEEFDIFDVIQDPSRNAESTIIRSQTHQKIRDIIDQLPEEQKEVLILRHYADLSFKEIADLTRVSINTALGRMRYAIINMRKIIEENAITLQ